MPRGFCGIGLHNPKHMLNIGSVIRACGVYRAMFLAITGKRYRKAATDTMKQHRHFPVFQIDDLRDIVPFGATPVAIDIIEGAIPLPEYKHPPQAFYIFGAEDETLGEDVTGWCKDIVYIPTARCMNLAATVNVVLYDRLSKNGMLCHPGT